MWGTRKGAPQLDAALTKDNLQTHAIHPWSGSFVSQAPRLIKDHSVVHDHGCLVALVKLLISQQTHPSPPAPQGALWLSLIHGSPLAMSWAASRPHQQPPLPTTSQSWGMSLHRHGHSQHCCHPHYHSHSCVREELENVMAELLNKLSEIINTIQRKRVYSLAANGRSSC